MILQKPHPRSLVYWGLVLLVFALGIALRVYLSTSFRQAGFDESFYRHYVLLLNNYGVAGYPKIATDYLEHQKILGYSVLPPMRFLYIFMSHLWSMATGDSPMKSLRNTACLFTIFTLVLSYVFAWRLAGKWMALGVLALMSCAPTQIHMSQHVMVDGFFAFWALLCLWLLWENLSHPNRLPWLLALGLALTCMVMTKENAFFAFVALCTIILCNRWSVFGSVTPRLLVVMFFGPLLGVITLMALAGGVHRFIETYQQSVSKNYTLDYAITTGDGPWYRYLSDMLLMSPVVFLLALGAFFHLRRDNKPGWLFTIFIAASYLIMCNIKYGMNLRYANMWDMPVRFMALSQMVVIAGYFEKRKTAVLAFLVIAVCLIDLRQYSIFFVEHDLYELPTTYLLHALRILK